MLFENCVKLFVKTKVLDPFLPFLFPCLCKTLCKNKSSRLLQDHAAISRVKLNVKTKVLDILLSFGFDFSVKLYVKTKVLDIIKGVKCKPSVKLYVKTKVLDKPFRPCGRYGCKTLCKNESSRPCFFYNLS